MAIHIHLMYTNPFRIPILIIRILKLVFIIFLLIHILHVSEYSYYDHGDVTHNLTFTLIFTVNLTYIHLAVVLIIQHLHPVGAHEPYEPYERGGMPKWICFNNFFFLKMPNWEYALYLNKNT